MHCGCLIQRGAEVSKNIMTGKPIYEVITVKCPRCMKYNKARTKLAEEVYEEFKADGKQPKEILAHSKEYLDEVDRRFNDAKQ